MPGTSRTLEFEWNPPATGHYCLLARWESTADPMRMPEGPIIATNVRNENNIVWRNLTVIGLLTAMPMSSEFRLARSWGFGEAATLAIRPTRGERDARFLRGGTITLHPDSTLLAFWRRQPRLPAAFRLAADSVIVVDPNGGELPLPGEERWSSSPMRVTFARRPDARLPRARFQFDFVVLARAGSARHAAGGVSYDIVTDDSMR